MTFVKPEAKPVRRAPGRRDNATRLAGLAPLGMDLRTLEGRHYTAIVHALAARFPNASREELKSLAALRMSLEIAQVDALAPSTDPWLRARSLEAVAKFTSLVCRAENDLREQHAPPPSPPQRLSLAEKLAARAAGA